MKIVTVIGARPQFIKAAALSRVLRQQKGVQEILVHTGQHYDDNMSEIFFEQMEIPWPDYHLGIVADTHGAQTGRMLEAIEAVLITEKPDRALVYGDTNSTLAGALAASKLHIPVAHVEAGLRSFNMRMPEEINRIVTDRLSDILFCPTDTAVKNLQNEGFAGFKQVKIVKSGDVMQDAAIYYASKEQMPELPAGGVAIEKEFGLVTLHRAENTDVPQRLSDIFMALAEISLELPLVMPVHPRTRQKLDSAGVDLGMSSFAPDKFCLIDPVGYLEMVFLLQRCSLVMTDSGGLQKEAFFFDKPCVTLRDETEWVELVDSGFNMLVGSNKERIIETVGRMKNVVVTDEDGMYGAGKAADCIVSALLGQLTHAKAQRR